MSCGTDIHNSDLGHTVSVFSVDDDVGCGGDEDDDDDDIDNHNKDDDYDGDDGSNSK